jgi:branched-chain amino acid transport system substrate-binding protein
LAAADRTTIGYLGDMNSGASAVSIPLLNRAGIAQVSPTSTAVGLTTDGPGSSPGEPDKYYPTRVRTFARVVPNDAVQARVQVRLQQSVGCKKTYVVNDGEVDGLETALSFVAAAKPAGLTIAGLQQFEPGQADYTSFATSVAATHPDCVLLSALPQNSAVLVTKQIAAALPNARIFCTAADAESAYADPSNGGIPMRLDSRILITVATLAPRDYPPPGREFFARYTQQFGRPPPYAVFGYEAMGLLLSSVERATDQGREPARRSGVVAALFSTHDRAGAVGTYTIKRDGDSTLDQYGVWRVVDGRLVFWKVLTG